MDYPANPQRQGVVAVVSRAGRLLVIRRSQQVVAPGALCFPGGGIEPGESAAAALIREIDEELGVAIEPVRVLWSSVTPWNVALSWWFAQLDPLAELKPNPLEVESVHWMTPESALARAELLESNREFLAAVISGAIELM